MSFSGKDQVKEMVLPCIHNSASRTCPRVNRFCKPWHFPFDVGTKPRNPDLLRSPGPFTAGWAACPYGTTRCPGYTCSLQSLSKCQPTLFAERAKGKSRLSTLFRHAHPQAEGFALRLVREHLSGGGNSTSISGLSNCSGPPKPDTSFGDHQQYPGFSPLLSGRAILSQ